MSVCSVGQTFRPGPTPSTLTTVDIDVLVADVFEPTAYLVPDSDCPADYPNGLTVTTDVEAEVAY